MARLSIKKKQNFGTKNEGKKENLKGNQFECIAQVDFDLMSIISLKMNNFFLLKIDSF